MKTSSGPEEAKAAFLNWIGIDAAPETLDRRYRNEHPGEGWHDSVHDYREVGMHAFQKWRSEEPLPDWCQQCLRECGDDASVFRLMNQLGYGADDVHEPDIDTGKAFLFRPRGDCD